MKMNSVIIRNKLAGFSMLVSGRSGLFDPHGFQFDGLLGLVARSARHFRNFGGHVHSLDHFAKNGVLVIEPGRRRYGDEKLASVRARAGVGHRELSRFVMPQGGVKFVAEAIARIAGSRPERTPALNHELRNHAMENEAVVKRTLHFLSGLRILEFLRAFREADEIRDRLRGFLFKQADHDGPLRSIEHGIRAWCAAQDHLLWWAKCAGIIAHSGRGGQHCPRKRRAAILSKRLRVGVLNFRPSRVASRRRAGESNDRQGDIHLNKVLIVGSGCAGLTAAIYAGRANLKPIVIDGYEPGGQLSLTTMVENFPGFPDGILGPDLIENMRKQAQRFGAEFKSGAITDVDLSKRPFKITAGNDTYETLSLIIAAGATARLMGLESERKLIGYGVSTCATCDGYFFRGKDIAVVGGGDSAMEEANFLSRFASKVYLVHRRKEFRASKIMVDRARANEKIQFVTPVVVEDISDVAKGGVEYMTLRNTETNQTSKLDVEGVFIAIGHVPNTKVFRDKLDMDENGYLITHHGSQTKIPGVFAAGDVQDHHYKQAVTAAGSGCMAAMDAEKFLEAHPDR